MLSLADTTDLLDQTTTQLMGRSDALTPKVGIGLLKSWVVPLQVAENTRPLANQLKSLQALLEATPLDEEAVRTLISALAGQVTMLATDMGGEGEMPALLEGLSVALRQASDSSKPDTIEPSA